MPRFVFRWVMIMGLLGLLLGCDEGAPLKSLPSQLILEAYKPTGELVSKRILGTDDPVYQGLTQLLNTEQSGWQRSFVSYKTGPYILRGENLIIRCYANMMVIDVVESGSSTSMKKNIPNLLQSLSLPAN